METVEATHRDTAYCFQSPQFRALLALILQYVTCCCWWKRGRKRTAGDIQWRYRIVELETNSGNLTLYTPVRKNDSDGSRRPQSQGSQLRPGRDDSGEEADDELGKGKDGVENVVVNYKAKVALFINVSVWRYHQIVITGHRFLSHMHRPIHL